MGDEYESEFISASFSAVDDPRRDVEKQIGICADGSVYVQPPIPGMDTALPVREVDAHEIETGDNVVVCGGGITGLECALALAQEGKSVTVVDQLKREDFIMEMPIFNKADLLDQLQKLNVTLIGGQRIQAVKDGVETVDKHRPITECTDEWWDEIIAIDHDKERGYSAGTEWYPLQCRLPGTNTDTAEYTGKSC